jgi:lysophospholipase L1-like esterase
MATKSHRFFCIFLHPFVLLAVGAVALVSVAGAGDDTTKTNQRFDAIGDSVTWGVPVSFEIDDEGTVRSVNQTYQGWPELIGNLSSSKSAAGTVIANLGVPGAEVKHVLKEHPRKIFRAWNKQADVLLLIGTNDSNPAVSTPSGLGCKGKECDDTYSGTLRRLVDNLQSNGRETIYIGRIPPVWGNRRHEFFPDPLRADATRNILIREYNQVITEELSQIPGVRLGPDLFSCFLTPEFNRFSLFPDSLHAWRDVIANGGAEGETGPCMKAVYFLESLDSYRYGHKQNLLSAGDPYYVDESHVLIDIPPELAAGIWVMAANADRDNQDEDFLSFDAGDTPVTVYIAYDSAGLPPISNSHEFNPVQLSSLLKVSDPLVDRFEFVAATDVTGGVRIGGNRSANSSAAHQSYIVIVVP